MPTKTIKVTIAYFDLFEYDSFFLALWDATKTLPFFYRLVALGFGAKFEKRLGTIPKNSYYQMTLEIPRFVLFRPLRATLKPLFK